MKNDLFLVLVEQAGGKYGKFECPICGEKNRPYKFSANSGWCDSCNWQFQLGDESRDFMTSEGKFGPHVMEFEGWPL